MLEFDREKLYSTKQNIHLHAVNDTGIDSSRYTETKNLLLELV
jgi:hypothetical protein